MSLREDLEARVDEYARSAWGEIPKGRVVPTADSLTFGNTGITIDACVLYADIHKSTGMVDSLSNTRAAEYYKAFLHCAAKIIKDNDGTIVAYDGDRVMALYMGINKADQAIRTAFMLHYAVKFIIKPRMNDFYGIEYNFQHTVGIDSGELLATKTGVRVDSDIVWVGNAANHASKLNSFEGLDISHPTRITSAVWKEAGLSWCFKDGANLWTDWYETGGIAYRASEYWLVM